MVQSHWPRPNGGLSRCRTWGVTVSRGMKTKGAPVSDGFPDVDRYGS